MDKKNMRGFQHALGNFENQKNQALDTDQYDEPKERTPQGQDRFAYQDMMDEREQ
jgi:hypothetical protein